MAQKLADAAGWEIKFFHEPRTIAVAALIKRRLDAETLTVEVLRQVRGLTRKELGDADLVELRPGQIYRIPSPVRLLKAKLANLREIKPTRVQDIHHARLLVSSGHHDLTDMHSQVAEKNLTERALVNALHELRGVIAPSGAHKLESEHALDLASALPEDLSTSGFWYAQTRCLLPTP